ncbi:fad-dependent oxidoreductase-like enzyme [Colletotrichum scovillei]|uniref:Fad-dependent oxidoreductase-like enzyme n=1 Tax=Colletotrichum scovillei TaxID=1209932 RepID=A0A9P7U6J7_9PEZI|nr:fad-dependent oxidoreductase-like enzyme [Colletotrichum scovillei]KAG7041458.1 fad-dependent oxidoreductase-like enzyme [Colletotrichum scovillei]KAG7061490.1 fad-dependent oxidoreductase-like enzyme [Colletotrichum scovillei]
MATAPDAAAQQPNDTTTVPTTPQDTTVLALNSSQVTLPSTEVPASPAESNQSFKTEVNDDRLSSSAVIPSSLTPPPSSQLLAHTGNGALQTAYGASQRSALFSPPATGHNATVRRDGGLGTEYIPPAPQQVVEATADELRAMMQASIAEHAKLKMEAAHHKLQYNLLSLQADEDAKRAAVEHEMTRREIEALRTAEYSRHAVRELSAASESAQMKYLQMKMWYEEAMDENEGLVRRVKMAKKVISHKEEEIIGLTEERDMLLNRIRENREHFHMLCSPGGIFHGAMTPKQPAVSTPQQPHRATPKQQTPRSANREARVVDRDHGPEPIAALLQALSQDNNSAPSTPTTAVRPAPRMPPKHTRNAQSLSALPTTPLSRTQRHEQQSGLLPSVNLVPQSEPRYRYSNSQMIPGTPPPAIQERVQERARKSRESTISADDNEELARQALESVAKSASFLSQASRTSRGARRPLPGGSGNDDEEEVYESQASQAASEMLRRDPRESFEVASSVGSRDGTPAPAEKSARLQAKLFSGITKSGADKRKFNGGVSNGHGQEARSDMVSPTKKMRVGGPLGGDNPKVGLGIQYGYS